MITCVSEIQTPENNLDDDHTTRNMWPIGYRSL